MTKADLIDEVSRLAELTRKDSEVIVETIFDSVVRSLRVGDKIEIRGFGSFRTRQRKPRVGRNPKTGDRVEVPAKKIPFFKPSKELKDLVNTGGGQTPAPPVTRGTTNSNARVRSGRSSAQPSKARLFCRRQNLDDLPRNFAVLHSQPPHRHRQPESSRPRAPRIEIKHAILHLRPGRMRMPAHHHLKSRSFRFEIQLVQIVKNVDRDAACFEHIRDGNLAGPGVAINIATNRGNRRNLSQLLQNGWVTDVTRMNDVVRTAKSSQGFRAKQAVSIGNDADDRLCTRRGRCPHLPSRAQLGCGLDADPQPKILS